MKPVLIVDGDELDVVNIHYKKGEIQYVQVDLGDNEFKTYSDKDYLFTHDTEGIVDMKKSLKFVGGHDELINHLDEQLRLESDSLTDIAIDAMEGKSDLPFNTHLVEMQKEYQLQKKRLDGFIDAVEEVKAFVEGWYDDKTPKGGE